MYGDDDGHDLLVTTMMVELTPCFSSAGRVCSMNDEPATER